MSDASAADFDTFLLVCIGAFHLLLAYLILRHMQGSDALAISLSATFVILAVRTFYSLAHELWADPFGTAEDAVLTVIRLAMLGSLIWSSALLIGTAYNGKASDG